MAKAALRTKTPPAVGDEIVVVLDPTDPGARQVATVTAVRRIVYRYGQSLSGLDGDVWEVDATLAPEAP